MNHRSVLIPALFAVLVSACTTVPQQQTIQPPASVYLSHLEAIQPISNFAISGRMAILTETKGFSGSIRWHHHEEGDDIQFFSPLGTQLGNISKSTDGVTLTTSNQKIYHADDAATLTQQTLGWSLPMDGLQDWMLGRPNATTDGTLEILAWDAQGNITHMRQNGWDIEYPTYITSEEFQLPGKIILKSDKLELKLVIEQWQTGQN